MSTKVFLVRHGETDWNRSKRFQGMSDIPLSNRGKLQAGCAQKAFADVQIDACYTSPLTRAKETGAIITQKHPVIPQVYEDLHEQFIGDWEGIFLEVIKEKFPEEFDNWNNHPTKVNIPNAETFQEVQDRMMKAFWDIVDQNQGKTILIVAHMVCLSTLTSGIEGLDMDTVWDRPMNNCGYCVVEVDDNRQARVTVWNEHEHLLAEDHKKLPVKFEDKKPISV